VMPDCGAPFKNMTSVSTHELIEAVTDNIPTPGSSPNYPQAWNDSGGNEMGDLCNSSSTVTTPLGMFTVQNIWDERTKACKAFSSDTNDYNVSISPNVAKVDLNASNTYTVQTATSAGAAQMLTLSATAPSGVTATISPTTIMSGSTATLTVVATSPPAQTGLQVVVRADASATQTHTAALLLSTTTFVPPPDLGSSPPDLAPAPADLAQGTDPGTGNGGDDMAVGTGVGGNGQPPPSHGCSYAATANGGSWPQATLLLLALALLAVRRRDGRA